MNAMIDVDQLEIDKKELSYKLIDAYTKHYPDDVKNYISDVFPSKELEQRLIDGVEEFLSSDDEYGYVMRRHIFEVCLKETYHEIHADNLRIVKEFGALGEYVPFSTVVAILDEFNKNHSEYQVRENLNDACDRTMKRLKALHGSHQTLDTTQSFEEYGLNYLKNLKDFDRRAKQSLNDIKLHCDFADADISSLFFTCQSSVFDVVNDYHLHPEQALRDPQKYEDRLEKLIEHNQSVVMYAIYIKNKERIAAANDAQGSHAPQGIRASDILDLRQSYRPKPPTTRLVKG